MKKISLTLLISSLLITHVFAEEAVDFQRLLNERNISKIKEAINNDPSNSEAYYIASMYYGVGDDELGTNKDEKKRYEYLKKSADLGWREAQLQYGFYLLNQAKSSEGLVYIKKAADSEYLPAIALLGDLYFAGYQDENGLSVIDSDINQAIIYLEKAVVENSQDARYTLGHIYLTPNFGKQDILKALELFEANINYDAKSGHLATLITLIDLYSVGEMVEPDNGKLIDYCYLASLQDYTPVLYSVGMMQRIGAKGIKFEIIKDPEAAFINLFKAASAGYIDAMFQVGEMYFKGDGVEQSDMDAYMWIAIAEELSSSDNRYSEIILELIPKREKQIAVDNKNHRRKFFTGIIHKATDNVENK
ncbi:tetratricopeptide repeat protein [Wohlfahrtiimonas populi]|uniref:tetratricopeptide repeat protein n=1 Tax=Wohlfahrtiimonas populi TaxID=1940240 RepID=UPI00098D377E|nr:SEL1-like repeat protein [Wohlfahrtiimonas populi]